MSGMVARTAVAALVGAVVGAVVLRILAVIVQPGLGGELIVLTSVGLALFGGFVGALYVLRAPERRLLADAVEVVTFRRR
jgi:uncharacterized membrane protein YdcZ (DUF606 family)